MKIYLNPFKEFISSKSLVFWGIEILLQILKSFSGEPFVNEYLCLVYSFSTITDID